MRRVMPIDEVFHAWAHQSQDFARSPGGSASFRDTIAYSYATPIGRILTNARGERAYLVTTRRYSATTSSKHIPALLRSIPYSALRFHAPEVAPGGMNHTRSEWGHADVLEAYSVRLTEAQQKEKRARTEHWRDYWTRDAADIIQEANEYCRFFDLADAFDRETVNRLVAEREAAIDRANAERAERERVWQLEVDARREEDVRRWLAGERVWVSDYSRTLLRVNPSDPTEVETSRGARVPIHHAARLFGAWLGGTLRVGAQVGLYRVDEIAPDRLTIGCHVITREEAERFAALQGWTDAAKSA